MAFVPTPVNAWGIIRLEWISLCSGEAGWVTLGCVDLELGTDPGMPPMWAELQNPQANCYIQCVWFSFLFFFNTTKTPHKADLKDEWKLFTQERAMNILGRGCARNNRGFGIKLNIREEWSQTSGVMLAIFFPALWAKDGSWSRSGTERPSGLQSGWTQQPDRWFRPWRRLLKWTSASWGQLLLLVCVCVAFCICRFSTVIQRMWD